MDSEAPSIISSYDSTYLYKLSNGMFNNKWHLRYFVFDGNNKELTYFKSEKEKKSRGHFKLSGATVSEISSVKGKSNPIRMLVTNIGFRKR